MKARIKIDMAIAIGFALLTGMIYFFPNIYLIEKIWDDFLDLSGVVVLLFGVFLRMGARGFKKAHSDNGQGLVIAGPYTLVRNPMYLGTFLAGVGFVLILWPWWMLPIFSIIFYLRFNRQIVKEEAHLKGIFGKEYEDYVKKVPRLFPNIKNLIFSDLKKALPWKYIWTTKEKWGLLSWPCLTFILGAIQKITVFKSIDWIQFSSIFVFSGIIFTIAVWLEYRHE